MPRLPVLPRLLRTLCLGLALGVGALGLATGQQAPATDTPAVVLTVDGPIAPAMVQYIERNLDAAAARGVPLVVLKMDTPGGLDSSTRRIIRAILASPVPVATWVAPSGARAASAGTYILYASHIAAMAPATNLGAATPVSLGGGGAPFSGDEGDGPDNPGDPDGEGDTTAKDGTGDDTANGTGNGDAPRDAVGDAPRRSAPASAMEAKVVNDASAYIRGLAELRGRNADWAERAVRDAVSLTATEAAAQNVIDFTADTLVALLAQADGRAVTMADGTVTLATAGIATEAIEPDWRTQLLAIITNPNVALILMLVGVYGIIFEFLSPGVLVPGTVGAISLILGMYSLAMLPLNLAGAGLILLGLALIVAEAFAPSFGVLGIGGTAALVLGAMMLVDTDAPGLDVSVPLLAGVAVSGLLATAIVATLARRSFRAPVVSGAEEMVGVTGHVTDWQGRTGHVFVHGERWQARGPAGLTADAPVRVTAMDGLTLTVEPQA
ncbi:nodulation protein NfeD [Rhodobaculum claviforme]|uniref:Nodulation protein NfeD n=2 Tax=Rhodobaculum claviforme TaxID=1549854 RepID=A0A934TNB8_9RHOB|nr:nodulation protein NfeD [Rhodobaculum claviforme]